MTAQTSTPPQDTQVQQNETSAKELNFRKQEQMYQRMLQERESRIAELEKARQVKEVAHSDDEEDDSEPYVDKKRLKKTLNQFGQNTQSDIQKALQQAKQQAKEELKQEIWLENNVDFEDTLNQHAEKLMVQAPELAKTILRMPDGFERQKLVYETIKSLGLHKPKAAESTIQDKIDANRKSPYYQPSGIGTAPFGGAGAGKDYSDTQKKSAYDQVMALKSRLRL